MSNLLLVLVLAVLTECLAGSKALKKVREDCRRNGTPVPKAEPILRKKYEFIPRIRHLLELAEKVEGLDPKILMGRRVLLRNTNPDIMLRIFPKVSKTFDQLWDEASPEFIEFLTAYQQFVVDFRNMWKNLPQFSRADVEGLPEHLYRSAFTSRTWDFLMGNLPELKFYKCFCDVASKCSYREDFGYDCYHGSCRIPAADSYYNKVIRGEKEIPAPNKYWRFATEKVNKYPNDLLIFSQKCVNAYWDKRNGASERVFRERVVYDSDSD